MERFEDWDEKEVFHTLEEVAEAIAQSEKEIEDEIAGIQGLQSESDT